jgi:hypothetical protein
MHIASSSSIEKYVVNINFNGYGSTIIAHYLQAYDVYIIRHMRFAAFWDIAPCSLVEGDRRFRGASIIRAMSALTIEAVRTSKTSVNLYEITRCNIPEGCHLERKLCSEEDYV